MSECNIIQSAAVFDEGPFETFVQHQSDVLSPQGWKDTHRCFQENPDPP